MPSVAPDPSPLRSLPSLAPGPTDPDFLDHLRENLINALAPKSQPSRGNQTPCWLSGPNSASTADFLAKLIQEISDNGNAGTLAAFSPDPGQNQLEGLADVFEQLFPALKRCDLKSIPTAGWAAMVKAEVSRPKKRSHLTCIVDEIELLFDEQVSESERIGFLRTLTELADSPNVSVLLVIDDAFLSFCRSHPFLDKSLDGPSHVRLPGAGNPFALRPSRVKTAVPTVSLASPAAARASTPQRRQALNPSSFRRQVVFATSAAAVASLALISALTFLGTNKSLFAVVADSSPYAGSAGEVVKPSLPRAQLTPVSASAADFIASNDPLRPEDLLRELDPANGLDLEIQIAKAFSSLREKQPKVLANGLEEWVQNARSLPATLGMLSEGSSKALLWFERGAREGCPESTYLAAEHLFLKGRIDLAVPYLSCGVDEFADPRAQYLLGVCFLHGRGGLSRDYLQARTLLELAIDAGNSNAYQEFAMMHEHGLGGEVDLRASTLNYRLGAQAGNRHCMARYANALHLGHGSTWRNPALAQEWAHEAEQMRESPLQIRVRELRPHLYR